MRCICTGSSCGRDVAKWSIIGTTTKPIIAAPTCAAAPCRKISVTAAASANNDCGFKGVTAWRGHWLARIYVNDHAVRLGIYDDLKTAAQAYDVAARLLFHGFAAFNLPDSPASTAPAERNLHQAPSQPARRCPAAAAPLTRMADQQLRAERESKSNSEMVWSALDIPVDLYGAVFA